MTEPKEPATWADIEMIMQLSNKIAVALTDAGIPPSSPCTCAMVVLAAANSQHLRRVPMTKENFLRMTGALWDAVAGSEWGRAPKRSDPTS